MFAITALLVLAGLAISLASRFKLLEESRVSTRFDVAKVADVSTDATHSVVFVVEQRNLDRLDEVLAEVSSPSSPKYGQYLTRAQVDDLTGNPDSHDAIVKYLKAFPEIEIEKESPLGNYIFAKAPVATWEEMFHCKFAEYAVMNYPNTVVRSDVLYVPRELDGHVSTVLNTVHLPVPHKKKNSMVLSKFSMKDVEHDARPDDATTGGLVVPGYVTPGLIAKYYNISNTIASFNVSQAVYESLDQYMSPSDLAEFQTNLGLLVQPVTNNIGGHTTDACTDDACGEANLDIQYIMGVAQNVNTTFYYTDDWVFGWITDVADSASPADVYSISYGSPEAGIVASYRDLFNTEALKLGAMGVTIAVSSGDDGAPGDAASSNTTLYCGYSADFPATSPYVTAVGASNGPQNGLPEVVCQASAEDESDYVLITSGGGFSNYFPLPSWQKAAVQQYLSSVAGTAYEPYVEDFTYINDEESYQYFDYTAISRMFNSSNRAYPDVSMLGHAYLTVVGGNYSVVDGTSASAPVFGAMVTLVNDALVKAGKPKLGFVNPFLYQYQSVFAHDITQGDNKCTSLNYNEATGEIYVPCCQEGFYAMPGWDPATGIGSVSFDKFLATALSSAPVSVAPSAAPTTAPTAAPTAASTTAVSAAPSAAPTAAPSLIPGESASPSAAPTAAPSATPSAVPTAAPTASAVPTVSPSAVPTASPSAVPTTAPTAMPTSSQVVAISYPVTQNFVGISIEQFYSNFTANSLVIAQTTATILNLSPSNIVVTGASAASSSVAALRRALATSAINVNYTVTIPDIYAAGYTSPQAAYTTSTSTLNTAIVGSTYTNTMQAVAAQSGVTTMATVTSNSADYGAYTTTTTTNDNGSGSKKLSGGAIAGIVIGVLAGVALIAFGIFYFVAMSNGGRSDLETGIVKDARSSSMYSASSSPSKGDSVFSTTDNPMRGNTGKFGSNVEDL